MLIRILIKIVPTIRIINVLFIVFFYYIFVKFIDELFYY